MKIRWYSKAWAKRLSRRHQWLAELKNDLGSRQAPARGVITFQLTWDTVNRFRQFLPNLLAKSGNIIRYFQSKSYDARPHGTQRDLNVGTDTNTLPLCSAKYQHHFVLHHVSQICKN